MAFTRYCYTVRLLCTNLSFVYCPLPFASPALLQYYCTTIPQYTTPPRPTFCITYTIQYWQWQYRVKAKLPLITPDARCVHCKTTGLVAWLVKRIMMICLPPQGTPPTHSSRYGPQHTQHTASTAATPHYPQGRRQTPADAPASLKRSMLAHPFRRAQTQVRRKGT